MWRIRNGFKVKIWRDKWLSIPSTFTDQLLPKLQVADAHVNELIDKDTHWWNHALIEAIFSPTEAEVIKSIPVNNTNQQDVRIWRGTAKSDFSVRSAYYLAKELEVCYKAKSSSRVGDNPFWQDLWKLHILNVEKHFLWLACHNLLPTKENLQYIKIVQDPSCPICGL